MDEVVDSVKRVTDIMSEITAASQEQSAGIEQVNQAIIEMDNVTQQNAALVEQAAAAAQSLQDQAAEVANVVSIFKLDASQQVHAKQVAASHHTAEAPKPPLRAQSQKLPTAPPKAAPKMLAVGGGGNADWEEF